jgi:hypothetical protein
MYGIHVRRESSACWVRMERQASINCVNEDSTNFFVSHNAANPLNTSSGNSILLNESDSDTYHAAFQFGSNQVSLGG